MSFKLVAPFKPAGDQPEAIAQLTEGLRAGERDQVLLGVTGSGKTFTIANVIEQVQRPTLILSHNKTLVSQLYGEFRQFFPENAVEYFVSYYDYYQPEAYLPVTDTYIEKDLSINEEIEKFRLSTTAALLSGRRDVIVVASVSCIYGIGNPADFKHSIIRLSVGQEKSRNALLFDFVNALYSRSTGLLLPSNFRVKGDNVEINPPYSDFGYRISFFGDTIEGLEKIDPDSGRRVEKLDDLAIFPATIYVPAKDKLTEILFEIQDELKAQTDYFRSVGKVAEAKRLEERTNLDLELIREMGYCSGIENYSRFFDRREPGTRPFCLLDYFPDDYLLVIDESHVTVGQLEAMSHGDKSRKQNLVDYGFRLPAAMDNRPLKFPEFESLANQIIYVSATPGKYELQRTGGVFIEQVVRPTGLLDPVIEIRPTLNQIDDLLDEIEERINARERVLVTTLTKRMAEELSRFFDRVKIKSKYIHSDVDTLERVELLRDLRLGHYDVLVGVNLLREGLDLPEVSLVAIMDADKEGFLRSETSLTQTAGRAARNINGKVIMYADKITGSMQRAINETERRRTKQLAYNLEHGITPQTIYKTQDEIMNQTSVLSFRDRNKQKADEAAMEKNRVADPLVQYMTSDQLEKAIREVRKKMEAAAKDMDFMLAAKLRDEMYAMQNILMEKIGK